MDPITSQSEQSQYQAPIVPEHKHFLNKKFAITFVILILLGVGAYAGISYWQKQQLAQEVAPTFTPRISSETYTNNQYGFSIALPDSWKGYTVLNSQWEGRDVATGDVTTTGPKIILRHPGWTTTNPREDMPVMIFTFSQLNRVINEKAASDNISVGAAPIPPSVLGQNSKYVIALPARYNFDYKTGFEEVDQLVHTLKAFEPTVSDNQTACTQEAKQCPDGSYVGRTGPNCEFAACSGDGTVTGHVTFGPLCPVEQVGHPCTPTPETYMGQKIVVRAQGDGSVVIENNLDSQGNFSINLGSGRYSAGIVPGGIRITGDTAFYITKGKTTTVNF